MPQTPHTHLQDRDSEPLAVEALTTGTLQSDEVTTSALKSTQAFTEEWLDGPLATKVYTRLYVPPTNVTARALLVFVHGYIEHIGRYTGFHSSWAENGVAVFAYDMRGFGRTALGEGKSSTSAYGKTGGARERMADLEWVISQARRKVPTLPVFIMGHSMGGGLVLSFMTRKIEPPTQETVASIAGVIASSPLVRVASRAPNAIQWKIMQAVSKIVPNTSLPSPVQDKDLSHDPAVGEESLEDPYIKGFSSAQGIADMIQRGNLLLSEGFKLWPMKTPVLILHGTADAVNTFEHAKQFHELLQASDKEFISYEGMMHDLMTEPDIKDAYARTCIDWVLKHVDT